MESYLCVYKQLQGEVSNDDAPVFLCNQHKTDINVIETDTYMMSIFVPPSFLCHHMPSPPST